MKRITFFLFLTLILLISSCDLPVEPSITAPPPTPTPTPIPEGFVAIPDVIGLTRKEAYELLEELGLIPLTFWVIHEEYSYGQVADIEPGVGEIVPLESEVVLDVVGLVIKDKDDIDSKGGGAECPPVPPLICSPELQAWCECHGGTYYENNCCGTCVPTCNMP